jgi:hypothetical protein
MAGITEHLLEITPGVRTIISVLGPFGERRVLTVRVIAVASGEGSD